MAGHLWLHTRERRDGREVNVRWKTERLTTGPEREVGPQRPRWRCPHLSIRINMSLLLLFPLLVFLQGFQLICVQLFLQRNLEEPREHLCRLYEEKLKESRCDATSWGGFHQRWAIPGFLFTA